MTSFDPVEQRVEQYIKELLRFVPPTMVGWVPSESVRLLLRDLLAAPAHITHESRSPDGDGLAGVVPASARPEQQPSVPQRASGRDNRVAGSEPADSQPLLAAPAAPSLSVGVNQIESEWALAAMTYARAQVCPNYGSDEAGTPYERGLIQQIAATYRDGWLAACARFREGVAAPAAPGWQPIETAPKDRAILIAGQFEADGRWLMGTGRWREAFEDELSGQWSWTWHARATHWQPLPAPPGAASQEP